MVCQCPNPLSPLTYSAAHTVILVPVPGSAQGLLLLQSARMRSCMLASPAPGTPRCSTNEVSSGASHSSLSIASATPKCSTNKVSGSKLGVPQKVNQQYLGSRQVRSTM
eukprot:1160498-Pelagomonas_calceolata.AAC.11